MKKQKGFSIVELMIGMAIGLIVIGAGITLVISQGVSGDFVTEQNKMENNLRIVSRQIGTDMNRAGYFGCQTKDGKIINQLAGTRTFRNNFEQYVYGFNANGASWQPTFSSATVQDVPTSGSGAPVTGSDILVIRGGIGLVFANRQSIAGTGQPKVDPNRKIKFGEYLAIADCSNTVIFQTTNGSDCNTSGDCFLTHSAGAGSPGNISNDFGVSFAQDAEVLPLKTITYFVARSFKCQNRGDCSENSLWKTTGNVTEEVAEGIDKMAILYIIENQSTKSKLNANEVQTGGLWNKVIGIEVEFLLKSEKQINPGIIQYNFDGQNITPTDRFARKVMKVTSLIRNRVQ